MCLISATECVVEYNGGVECLIMLIMILIARYARARRKVVDIRHHGIGTPLCRAMLAQITAGPSKYTTSTPWTPSKIGYATRYFPICCKRQMRMELTRSQVGTECGKDNTCSRTELRLTTPKTVKDR